MSAKYAADDEGRAVEAVMPVEECERLVEAFEELEDIRVHDEALEEMERVGSKGRPLEDFKAEIERAGVGGGRTEQQDGIGRQTHAKGTRCGRATKFGAP